MSDRDELQIVCSLLSRVPICVRDVPECASRRCDLRANDDRDTYLIEVKRFHDDEDVCESSRTGRIYFRERDRFIQLAVEKRIAEAVKQLEETAAATEGGLRIVALFSNDNYGAGAVSILGALYGIQTIAGEKRGSLGAWDCLYFSHSAFHRHRAGLDGIMLFDSQRVNLLLNDYGAHVDQLRSSRLAQAFIGHRALRDQASFGNDGFLIADCPIDRNNEAAVLRYLEEKYCLHRAVRLHSREYRAATFLHGSGRNSHPDKDPTVPAH